MKAWKLLLAACLALPPLPRVAQAGCRAVRVHHKQAAVVFAPSYPAYYYTVGQNLQLRAMVQQELQALLSQAQQQAQQLQAQPCPDGSCPTPQSQQLTVAPDRWALVKANCAGCHSTSEDAMAAVNMTDLSALSCETKMKMAAAILDGKMPPKKTLDANALGQLLGEIVGAQTVEK